MNKYFCDLLSRAEYTPSSLFLLNVMLGWSVPFQTGHGMRIILLRNDECAVCLPYRRKNMNHLRTLHAVAIANAAELSTGALLARTCVSLPIQLVLRSMNIEFHQPATQAVVARCVSDPSTFALIPQVLDRDGKVGMKLQSEVFDISGNHVATGLFDWRILQNALEDETAIS